VPGRFSPGISEQNRRVPRNTAAVSEAVTLAIRSALNSGEIISISPLFLCRIESTGRVLQHLMGLGAGLTGYF